MAPAAAAGGRCPGAGGQGDLPGVRQGDAGRLRLLPALRPAADAAAPGAAAPQSVRNAPAQPITAPGSGPANVPAACRRRRPRRRRWAPTPWAWPTTMAMPQPSTPAVTPTPPAGMPRQLRRRSRRRRAPRAGAAGRDRRASSAAATPTGTRAPNDAFAQTMAPSAGNLDLIARRASAARDASARRRRPQPDMPAAPAIQPVHGTLVAVNRDGSDGRVIEIAGRDVRHRPHRGRARVRRRSLPGVAPRAPGRAERQGHRCARSTASTASSCA